MIDANDELSRKFDDFDANAIQRGWGITSHARPARYGETLRIEKLEAPIRGKVRTSAVRAIVRLSPAQADRNVWVSIEACFQTGVYLISYYAEDGVMTLTSSGQVEFYKLYLDRGDVQQALNIAYEMVILDCLARILKDAGHQEDAERLTAMRKSKCGEAPERLREADTPSFGVCFRLEL